MSFHAKGHFFICYTECDNKCHIINVMLSITEATIVKKHSLLKFCVLGTFWNWTDIKKKFLQKVNFSWKTCKTFFSVSFCRVQVGRIFEFVKLIFKKIYFGGGLAPPSQTVWSLLTTGKVYKTKVHLASSKVGQDLTHTPIPLPLPMVGEAKWAQGNYVASNHPHSCERAKRSSHVNR